MRTRKSNRTKRYTINKYDFEGSSADEEVQQPLSRRQKRAEERDANFDDAAALQDESHGESDEEAAAAVATPGSEESPGEHVDETTRRRVKPVKPSQVKAAGKTTAYLDVEPIATDSHMPRGYAGSFDRHFRGTSLVRAWYGPDRRNVEIALKLLDRWIDWPLLPPRETVGEVDSCPEGIWDRAVFERVADYSEKWQARLKADKPQGTILSPLSEEQSWPYRLQPGTLPVLMGPHTSQADFKLTPGRSYTLHQTGLPIDHNGDEAQSPSGWIFDAGGIVLSLDWAQRRTAGSSQILALAVIPHSDQEYYNYEEEALKPDFQKHGTVQIWEFNGQKHGDGSIRPAAREPELLKTICLDLGRARRVKWSPVFDHLAILSGDGSVIIAEPFSDGDAPLEKVHRPLAIFSLEDDVKATAMTWVNFNRLAVGYSDGSIALWSIHPNCLLLRHPAHHSSIIDMISGYPTLPYLVATIPIGGYTKLIDLRSPSYETTEVPSLAVSTTPNVLGWSEHLKGFFALSPSSNVLNTMVGFMHHAYFPIVRRAYPCDSFVTSLSVGRTHPFLLVGSADGSLGAMNSQFETIQLLHGRREVTDRIRVFQHEHRPRGHFDSASPAAERGASRILHGFKPEKNRHAKADSKGAFKKPKKKKKSLEDDDDEAENEETTGLADPSRGIVYEPLTRITAVEWNPNEGCGCWAAAAMGSGLVKVMDLGIDMPADEKKG